MPRGVATHFEQLVAFRWAFTASALLVVVTLPMALRIRDDLAAATMSRDRVARLPPVSAPTRDMVASAAVR